MEDNITITQHLGFIDYYLLTLRALFKFKIVRIIILAITLLNLLSWLLLSSSRGNFKMDSLLESIQPIFLIVLIYAFLGLLSVVFVRVTKPQLFRELTYQFNHWGIQITGEGYTASLPWKQIPKFNKTRNSILLYEGKVPSIKIAKRSFTSSDQWDAFELLIEEKLSNKKP